MSEPQSPPPAFRPTAVVAWLVIAAVCGWLLLLHVRRPPTPPVTAGGTPTVDFQTLVAGRYAVGVSKLFTGGNEVMEEFAGAMPSTPEGRLAGAIVAGELGGADAALQKLDKIDDPDAKTLRAWYRQAKADVDVKKIAADMAAASQPISSPATSQPATAPASTSPTQDAGVGPLTHPTTSKGETAGDITVTFSWFDFNADALRPRLGWFVDLALSYGKPDADPQRAAVLGEAKQTVYALVGALTLIGVAAVSGLTLFVTAIVLLTTGRLKFAVGRPVGAGYVYVETVAIYLGGFVAVSYAFALLFPGANLMTRLLGQAGVVVLAAVWPLLRGVPWAALRQDWGVHAGRNFFVEILAGAGGYLAGLPVLFLGICLTLLLQKMSHANVSHPIANEITSSPPWMLFALAAVFAPLTEELIFRGALVSHLRGRLNVALAAVVSGVIFAAVHPQGWAAIPTIGGIGAVLALVRQWRGSLVASITAHAINNGFVVALLTLATR